MNEVNLTVSDFFMPVSGNKFDVTILTALNIIIIVITIILTAYLSIQFIRACRSKHMPAEVSKGQLAGVVSIVSLIILGLCALSIYGQGQDGGNEVLRRIYNILNPVFSIGTFTTSPFLNWFGINLFSRLCVLTVIAVAILGGLRASKKVSVMFGEFLKKSIDKEKPEETDKNSESIAVKTFSHLPLLSIIGIIVSIFTYVFVGEPVSGKIAGLFGKVAQFLSNILLLGSLQPPNGDAASLLINFGLVLLAILIAAIYISIYYMFRIFIDVIHTNRESVKKWIWVNRVKVWRFAAVLAGILLVILVLFLAANGYDTIQSLFLGIFNNGNTPSSANPFLVLLYILAFIAVLCAASLLAAFWVSFVFAVGHFSFFSTLALIKHFKSELTPESKVSFAKFSSAALIAISGMTALLMNYKSIGERIHPLFFNGNDFNFKPVITLGMFVLLIAVISIVLLIVVTVVIFIASILWSAVRLFKKGGTIENTAKLLKGFISIFSFLPFTVKTLYRAAKTFTRTLLQIFIGYERESDKNRALFVSACFASLASLLNTYLGIIKFYSDDTWIPAVCGFAISFAVQLAMLIFGLKAGEGLAENIITQQRASYRGGLTRVILKRLLFSLFYLVGYFALLWFAFNYYKPGTWILKDITKGTLMYLIIAIIGGGILLYLLAVQAVNIHKLCKSLMNAKSADDTAAQKIHAPLLIRLPFYLYLMAYLLLMVISTGFAYNNLFSYYAKHAKVYQNVYDEIQYMSDEKLGIFHTIRNMENEYASNVNALISKIEKDAIELGKAQGIVISKLEAAANRAHSTLGNENVAWLDEDSNKERYLSSIKDIDNTIANIKTILYLNYELSLGKDLSIQNSMHYWGTNTAPTYTTRRFVFEMDPEIAFGADYEQNPAMTNFIDSNGVDKLLPTGRRKGDNESMSVDVKTITIQGVDKYALLREVYSYYSDIKRLTNDENQRLTANGFTGVPFKLADNSDDFLSMLNRNAMIDNVCLNVIDLLPKEKIDLLPKEKRDALKLVSVNDLTQIAHELLRIGDTENDDPENDDPETNYRFLADYIDTSITLSDILSGYLPATKSDDGSSGSDNNGSPALIVRNYRNYAQALTNSEFHISYDVLFDGEFDLNPVKGENGDEIDTLYSSRPVALFLFIICALIDLMSFFAGLLLFKDIYLFANNKRLEELGYADYDAALTNIFTLPKAKGQRLLHRAYVFWMLYGKCTPDIDAEIASIDNDLLEEYAKKKYAQLNALGIESGEESASNLLVWLDSFAKRTNMSLVKKPPK